MFPSVHDPCTLGFFCFRSLDLDFFINLLFIDQKKNIDTTHGSMRIDSKTEDIAFSTERKECPKRQCNLKEVTTQGQETDFDTSVSSM